MLLTEQSDDRPVRLAAGSLKREKCEHTHLVIGDEDGMTFIPFEDRARVLERCRKRIAAEAEIVRRIEAGETTVEIMKLAV